MSNQTSRGDRVALLAVVNAELYLRLPLTIRIADHRPVIWTETRLHLPPSDLQLVGVGQVGPAHVARPLLLTGSALGHVDGHPGRPGSVPLHLWTCLQVAGLVLLKDTVEIYRQVLFIGEKQKSSYLFYTSIS